MNTIIVYGSKYGCTEKCAEMLSKKLTGTVELCNIKKEKVPDLTQYDNVIIGGSIYVGKIQKEVTEFCLHHANTLKEKKIGLYICCMNTKEAEMQLDHAFPEELLSNAAVKECFGGEFRFKKMNMIERFIVKMVSKSDKSGTALDTSKDISLISDESINRFVQLMNTI